MNSIVSYFFRGYVFFLLPFFISCNNSKVSNDDNVNDTSINNLVRNEKLLTIDSSANLFYKVLAGLFDNKEISSASGDTAHEYDDLINEQWNKMNERLLIPIDNWKSKNIPSECSNAEFLLYPFSGPDFIIPNRIFKKAKKIVMFGLEWPGSDISSRGFDYALSLRPFMQNALRDYFGKSYFITKNMNADLRNDSLTGVASLISVFMLREGYTLVSIKNFYINTNGDKVYYDTLPLANFVKGIEFQYTPDGFELRKLDYLSFNAEDQSIDKHPELKNFLEKSIDSNITTYAKSASYLMHYESFSYVRNLCLKKSKYILQDDTGISINYLDSNWNINLWGVYEKPISDFSGVYQKSLDSLYRRKGNNSTLPFNMGYHYFNGKQNLMLFTKISK